MRHLSMKETKDILLDILIQFDKYCTAHGLRYYLCGGALIGAIRNKGFIPWDDDIDVLMPRPDYERLIDLESKKKIAKNLELFNFKKNNSRLVFAKLGNLHTPVLNKYQTEKEYISIDIFPLDGASKDKKLNKIRYAEMFLLHNIYSLHLWKPGHATKKWINITKTLAYPLAKLISHEYVCKRMDRLASQIPFDSAELVGDILWGYGVKEIMKKDEFILQEEIEFEGLRFKTTKAYDKYLSQTYGEYMTLPPIEKRKNHELNAYMEGPNEEGNISNF